MASGIQYEDMRQNSVFKALMNEWQVHTKDTVLRELALPNKKLSFLHDRELLAAIDYAVCKRSSTFIGNSVSTFSALMLLSLQHESFTRRLDVSAGNKQNENWLQRSRRTSVHYNGGDIPLEEIVPIERSKATEFSRPLKWYVMHPFGLVAENNHCICL